MSLDNVPVVGEADISSVGSLELSMLGLAANPHNITVSLQAGAGQVCLTVETSQPSLLSHLKNESVGSSSCQAPMPGVRSWTAHQRQHLPHNWCQQPGEQELEIKLGSLMPGLETFLNQDQRDVMYSHLMTTSVIIIILCLLLVLWAGVRRDTRDSLTLLPTSDSEDM